MTRFVGAGAIMIVATIITMMGQAHAGMIVDTGTPTGGPDWSFYAGQYFAGKFSVSGPDTITSVEGYFSNHYGTTGNVAIALHSDTGNIPGGILCSTNLPVFQATALGWHGVFGLHWAVTHGTYWMSFKPDSHVSGSMPGHAPNPLGECAQGSGNYNWQDHGPNYFDYLCIGVRICDTPVTAVPEPSSFALACLGGIGLVVKAVRRRRTAI